MPPSQPIVSLFYRSFVKVPIKFIYILTRKQMSMFDSRKYQNYQWKSENSQDLHHQNKIFLITHSTQSLSEKRSWKWPNPSDLSLLEMIFPCCPLDWMTILTILYILFQAWFETAFLCRTICLPTSVNSSSTLPWISLRNSRIREVQSMCLSRSNLYTFVMYSYLGVIDKVNGSLISAYITAGSMFPDSWKEMLE